MFLFFSGGNHVKLSIAIVSLMAGALIVPSVLAGPKPPASVVTAGTQKSWSDGQKRSEKGADRIARGEEDIRDADKLKREGEANQSDGNARAQTAREAHARYLTTLSPAQDPAGVRAQAEALNDQAKRWQNALDLVKDGEKKLKKAEELRVAGEKHKVDGAALAAEGERIKATAEGRILLPVLPK
jgi:hypothetical protein